jgi:hypothetical protein
MYEAMVANKNTSNKLKQTTVIDDDDLDTIRIKKEKVEEEFDETKVRIRKPTEREKLKKGNFIDF